MPKKIDIVGKKYNRLTVLEQIIHNKRYCCKCLCDCGKITIVNSSKLKSGHTKSCGCLNYEERLKKAKLMNKAWTKYEPRIATAKGVWERRYVDDGNLKFEDFLNLTQEPCYYCGALPNNKQNSSEDRSSAYAKANSDFIYNGLDRFDNSKPHQLDNVVPCCKYCNYAKRELSFEEFDEFMKDRYQELILKKESKVIPVSEQEWFKKLFDKE